MRQAPQFRCAVKITARGLSEILKRRSAIILKQLVVSRLAELLQHIESRYLQCMPGC